jgi:hypothetical protein
LKLLEACSIRVQQFEGKHGQSWKVAEKLKESDSYVILCVYIEVRFALDVYPMELLGGSSLTEVTVFSNLELRTDTVES